MDLSHIGGLFWVVVVALMFISSMKRSGAKRSPRRAQSWSAAPPRAVALGAPAPRAPVAATLARPAAPPHGALAQRRVRELPVMPPVLPRAEMPSPLAPHPLDLGPPRRKRSSRMPFTSRGDLVRAVIAREVLGPPLASRERSTAAFGEPYAHG